MNYKNNTIGSEIIKKNLTLGSLFDGIGGFPYAASFYGIKTLWASEILPTAIAVTRRHFHDMQHVGDITKLSGSELPPVDIITFGSPCQDLSVAAGHRAGLDGKRSGLFYEAIRIINEMRNFTNGKYPRYALWENVPGALHSKHGADFKVVLEAFTDSEIPMPASGRWATAGMVRSGRADLAWCVYNAADFGTAQRRKRVFLITDFGGLCAGKILLVPKGLPGNFAAGRAQGQSVTAAVAGCFDGADSNCLTAWDTAQKRIFTPNGNSPTLTGADGGGGRNPAGLVFEQKTYGMCSTKSNSMLSDNPASGFYEADTSRTIDTNGGNPCCNQGGMLVAAFLGRASPGAGSIGYSELEAPTLRAGIIPEVCEPALARTLTARGDSSPCIDRGQNIICVASTQTDAAIDDNLCATITAATGTSGNNKPFIVGINGDKAGTLDASYHRGAGARSGKERDVVVHPKITGTLCSSAAGLNRPGGQASETELTVAYCLQGSMIGRDDGSGPQGSGINENISFTLNSTDRPAVAAIDCRNGAESGQFGTLQAKPNGGYSLNTTPPVRIGYTVRRLTPIECERLQGYPDGWTAFGDDGKEISDSKRYQMLGNSIAVPCVAHIMRGIAEAEEGVFE